MRATVRAHSRDVSTSSAATIQSGGAAFAGGPTPPDPPALDLVRAEPGKMANRALRAPRYSARGRRPGVPEGAWAGSAFIPICESRPASRERCNLVRSSDDELT